MKTFAPGTTIGPYVVDAELARGGMGAVYRAHRSLDGGVVALKILHAGPGTTNEQRERFRREAQLAAGLVHPGIVRVHAAGEVSWLSYIAMDLIEGESLAARAGRLAPLEAAGLLAQVARAIEHAHANGVIHRDLKPSNVLVRRDDGRALVTDFGVARHVESAALTKTGALVGTPTYLSPEQAGGLTATTASDVHALGAVLYELLTGLPPFRRDDLQSLLVAITTEQPEPPSALTLDVPRALDRVCLAALAKSPAARPSAGELAAELEAIAEGRAGARRGARGVVAALVGLAVLVVVVVVAAFALTRTPHDAPPVTVTTERSRPDRRQPPPRVVAWSEPAWLRELAARGDSDALLKAHDVLDANEALEPPVAVDERTRARAIEVLRELDRRWIKPEPTDPARADAYDRLAWIHWLWFRVDPGYTFPPDREAILEVSIMDILTKSRPAGDEKDPYVTRAGRAAIALQPQQLSGYMLYASGVKDTPWSTRAPALLRAGLSLTNDPDTESAWSHLARSQALCLDHLVRTDPARTHAERDELLAIARRAFTRKDLTPTNVAEILTAAAPHVPPDEAATFLARAEELGGAKSPALLARASLLHRAGRLDEAYSEAVRAAEMSDREWGPCTVQAYTLVADVALESRQPGRAHTALEQARDRSGKRRHPGVALRRVLLMVDQGDTAELEPALAELASRLTDQVERHRKVPDVPREDRARLADALADATAAARAPARSGELLRRWATPELLALLDR